MRSSFFTLFALGGLIASVAASPVAVAVEKRQDFSAVSSTLSTLTSSVQASTASINSTVASISSSSSADQKSSAASAVTGALADITTAVNTAIGSISALQKRELVSRQDLSSITAELTALLQEIFSTLSGAISALGLSSLLGFLTPLVTALGNLILALVPVVDDLLAVVKQLLDSLLIGLGLGLEGLTL